MNVITKRFQAIKEANPNFSSYTTFANAILTIPTSPPIIVKFFDELVEKKDYMPSEKEAILAYLCKLTA